MSTFVSVGLRTRLDYQPTYPQVSSAKTVWQNKINRPQNCHMGGSEMCNAMQSTRALDQSGGNKRSKTIICVAQYPKRRSLKKKFCVALLSSSSILISHISLWGNASNGYIAFFRVAVHHHWPCQLGLKYCECSASPLLPSYKKSQKKHRSFIIF